MARFLGILENDYEIIDMLKTIYKGIYSIATHSAISIISLSIFRF